MAEEASVEPQDLLPQAGELGEEESEGRVIRDRPDVPEVVRILSRSRRSARSQAARGGTRIPAISSTARHQARAWANVESPEIRPASLAPSAHESDSNRFSIPLWTYPSRSSRFRIVSPTAWKRKWPGSMIPAWTGPTGIS